MKSVLAAGLFSGLAAAHSAAWSVTVDGAKYPARDVRSDNVLGAKRIEWKFDNAYNFPWHAITDVESQGFACGDNPHPPELKAYARAGSNVTVQWSNIIHMHSGPVISYLGAWNGPSQKPSEVEFFKIAEAGYDKARRKWANEDLIDRDTADTFQLPSDIKPGVYILRSELLALHGNSRTYMPSEGSGPQFYIHCFNLDISGDGKEVPKGVKFPGGYKRDDPGVKFNLYRGGQADRDNYVIPGPPKYAGKYDAPPATSAARAVTDAERGLFPAAFQAKYDVYKGHNDQYAIKSADFVNMGQPGTRMKSGLDRAALQSYFRSRTALNADLTKELAALRVEAVSLGLVKGK